jgi:hypothetical protein
MTIVASPLPYAPPEREPNPDPCNAWPAVSSTKMTIAAVGEPDTRGAATDVAACLAALAVTDELIVLYGSDAGDSGRSIQLVVAGLRELLPRHTVVVLYAGPHGGAPGREATLLNELLELGSLPIVVTPAETVPAVAAQLCGYLQADRVLQASFPLDGDIDLADVMDLQELCWRRAGVDAELVPSCAGSCAVPGLQQRLELAFSEAAPAGRRH